METTADFHAVLDNGAGWERDDVGDWLCPDCQDDKKEDT